MNGYLLFLQTQAVQSTEVVQNLQEMKDKLILVSNELLDDAAELSPSRAEQLRLERYVPLYSSIEVAIVMSAWLHPLPFVIAHMCCVLLVDYAPSSYSIRRRFCT